MTIQGRFDPAKYRRFTISKLRMRAGLVAMWAFVGSLATSYAIFFLDGFSVAGFDLPDSLINTLAGATVVQISAIAGIIYRFLFPSREKAEDTEEGV